MADKETPEEKPTEKEEEVKPSAEATKTDTDDKPHMIPKSRLDEKITEVKELKGRLDAIEVANKEAEEKRLKDNEEWKTLFEKISVENETLKPKAEIADKQEAIISAQVISLTEALPEDVRLMVPEHYSTLDKLGWLNTFGPKLMKPTAPDILGKTGGENGNLPSLTVEQKLAAKNMNVSEKDYAKNL